MAEFAGWEMPLQYATGMVAEHLATRAGAGLFDVSHMGRFVIRGLRAVAFLQHVLTGNVEALDVGMAADQADQAGQRRHSSAHRGDGRTTPLGCGLRLADDSAPAPHHPSGHSSQPPNRGVHPVRPVAG